MGIKKTAELIMYAPPTEARDKLVRGLEEIGAETGEENGVLLGHLSRAIKKNRWAGELRIEVQPFGSGSIAVCTVDMAGTKHGEVLEQLTDAVGADAFDDRGVGEALGRLGKTSKLFGRKELRHLPNLLDRSERVESLAQGELDKKQGIVVLTNERLAFFEKSMGGEELREFPIAFISSITQEKKAFSGEKLVVHVSGASYEIKRVAPGETDELLRRFRALKRDPKPTAADQAGAQPDYLDQIERLGQLRDKGALTEEEFEKKKQELLDRL
jgi:hypothetical protein